MNYPVSDPRFWEERNKRKNQPRAVSNTPKVLNEDSSSEDKEYASSAVYDMLSTMLFDKISFISFPFTKTAQIYPYLSDGINTTASYLWGVAWVGSAMQLAGISRSTANVMLDIEGPVTDTARFWGISRIPNTSEGKFLTPDNDSRMRCSFYVSNGAQLEGYILSPVVYDSFASLNYFTSMDIFRAYVGLKFHNGQAYTVVKEIGKDEVLNEIEDVNVSGSSSSDTYRLDMVTSNKSTKILIDGISVGELSSDFTTGKEGEVDTYLPLLSPAKSTNGDEVGITVENFQFIQNNY